MTLPFIVLHGAADKIVDPEVSRALYDRAGSTDKSIKLYPGMWHGLTSGEPEENVEIAFSDIIVWLDKRATYNQAPNQRDGPSLAAGPTSGWAGPHSHSSM